MPADAGIALGVWEACHCLCCNLQSLLLGADESAASSGVAGAEAGAEVA